MNSLRVHMALLVVVLLMAPAAEAGHVPTDKDVAQLRPSMPNEGYLQYVADRRPDADGRCGDEWTGWLDVRHPSKDLGQTDTVLGYDRSDRWVYLSSAILVDDAGIVAMPSRVDDFTYTNATYMLQAGVSVIEPSYGMRRIESSAQSVEFSFPLSHGEQDDIMGTYNSPTPFVDNYYADSIDAPPGFVTLGETTMPNILGPEGIFLASGNSYSTMGHELYHFMGDGEPVHEPLAGDTAHSSDPRNLIAAGQIRWRPGDAAGGTKNVPWPIMRSPDVIGPPISTFANGSPRSGGVCQLTSAQVEHMFGESDSAPWFPAEQRGRNPYAGDRVDWDFVVDHDSREIDHDLDGTTAPVRFGLENLGEGADNSEGNDYLCWAPGVTAASSHAGHAHNGLDTFDPTTPDWGPSSGWESFRYIDVFSLNVPYSDADTGATGAPNMREQALDYDIHYKDLQGNLQEPRLVAVYTLGWTNNQAADDYLARWFVPDAAGALEIYIGSLWGDGHDMTTQIDAVIVAGMDVLPAEKRRDQFTVVPSVPLIAAGLVATDPVNTTPPVTVTQTNLFAEGGTGPLYGELTVKIEASTVGGPAPDANTTGTMDTFFLPNEMFATPPDSLFLEQELRFDGYDATPLFLLDGKYNLTYQYGDKSFLLLFDTQSSDGTVQNWQIQGEVPLGQDYTFGELILVTIEPDQAFDGMDGIDESDPSAAFSILIGLDKVGENVDVNLPLFTMDFRSAVPEPATLAVLSLGGVALLVRRRRAG